MQGTQQIANMPANITDSFLGKSVPVVAGTGINALNTAASLNTTTNTTPSFWDFLFRGLGSAGSTGGAALGAYAGSGGFSGGGAGGAAAAGGSQVADASGNLMVPFESA